MDEKDLLFLDTLLEEPPASQRVGQEAQRVAQHDLQREYEHFNGKCVKTHSPSTLTGTFCYNGSELNVK